jgi:hypothetical protein
VSEVGESLFPYLGTRRIRRLEQRGLLTRHSKRDDGSLAGCRSDF